MASGNLAAFVLSFNQNDAGAESKHTITAHFQAFTPLLNAAATGGAVTAVPLWQDAKLQAW